MKKIFGIAAAAMAVFMLSNCKADHKGLTGSWKSAAPISVSEKVADATYVSQSMSIDFQTGSTVAEGPLQLESEYELTAPADSTGTAKTYKVVAKVSGTWSRDVDDDDDYLLTFDRNTLSVAGEDAPELGPVTDLFMNSLTHLSTIEDVKVSKDGLNLSFETENPELTYRFVKK